MSNSVTFCVIARQPPYPWDFSGKDTGVGCHFPTPGDLPDPGIKSTSPVSPALQDSLPTEPSGTPHHWELIGLCQAGHTLHLACLANAGDSDTALALVVSYQLSLTANWIQEDLTISPSIRGLPWLCLCLPERRSRRAHWFPHLEKEAVSHTGSVFFHLQVWSALDWLVASSVHLVLQGQGAGSFKLHFPEAHSSSLTVISPSRETTFLSAFFV